MAQSVDRFRMEMIEAGKVSARHHHFPEKGPAFSDPRKPEPWQIHTRIGRSAVAARTRARAGPQAARLNLLPVLLLRFENPKIGRIDHSEIISDRIAEDGPIFRYFLAEEM